jgi:hypothetical protein
MTTTGNYFGPALSLGSGLLVGGERIGISLGYQFEYAPVIDNLLGDTHAMGGHRAALAVSYGF